MYIERIAYFLPYIELRMARVLDFIYKNDFRGTSPNISALGEIWGSLGKGQNYRHNEPITDLDIDQQPSGFETTSITIIGFIYKA